VIVLWDRTRGSADVKIIAALGEQPNYLVTNNPNIQTLKDFTKSDKIAVAAVVVSSSCCSRKRPERNPALSPPHGLAANV
jgi:hypothetical protein